MSGGRLEERIERARMATDAESREGVRAVSVFAGLTALYGVVGDTAHASLFFATAGAIAIGGKAWYSLRRNSHVAAATESDWSKVLRHGPDFALTLVAMFAFAVVMVISMPAFAAHGGRIALIAPVIVGVLAYRRRKLSDPVPEHTLVVTGAYLLVVAAVASLFWLGSGGSTEPLQIRRSPLAPPFPSQSLPRELPADLPVRLPPPAQR
jgi:hypothetical protein